jgi:hypothetical protein
MSLIGYVDVQPTIVANHFVAVKNATVNKQCLQLRVTTAARQGVKNENQ